MGEDNFSSRYRSEVLVTFLKVFRFFKSSLIKKKKKKHRETEVCSVKYSLNLTKESNVFIFKDIHFKQVKRAPIVSPIFNILAEYKLRPLEEHIFQVCNSKRNLWLRCVKVVCIREGGTQSVENCFDYINQIDNNIKFTMNRKKF